MPNFAYPLDPKSNDPGWKDITDQCKSLVEKLLAKATELFGQPTNPIDVRVTDFSEGPRTCFYDGTAYIRIPPGVSSDERELKSEIAHEIVHVLSGDVPNTYLEEGLCVYFAVKYGDAFPPHADDSNEQKYYEAYRAVAKLLEKCPAAIRQLRAPPRSLDAISADEIRDVCPDCSKELATRLARKW